MASNKRPSELVDFERLAVALSASLCTDAGLLLSYVTLSTNSRFVSHLSSSAATSRFVQGLLKELYEAESNKHAHVSQLIVTIFLILSQDVRFNRMMQTETISVDKLVQGTHPTKQFARKFDSCRPFTHDKVQRRKNCHRFQKC